MRALVCNGSKDVSVMNVPDAQVEVNMSREMKNRRNAPSGNTYLPPR